MLKVTVVKIGNIELSEQPLLLAPMEDVTDKIFRRLCKSYGADLMYTEFVSADALVREVDKTLKKMELDDQERPIGIQIYGKDEEAMVEAARIAEDANPDLIDINFGCPVKKIASKGAGAGMLRDIPKMISITRSVVNAVKKPVTVKTRLGWDESSKNIIEIAEQLQDVGIQALTIHGRTRSQMYSGEADWTLIGKVKNNPRMSIPIIGNGDITNPLKAKQYLDKYGVDALMIGRAAIGRPWIFKEIKHYLKKGELCPTLTIPEHVEIIRKFVHQLIDWLGERKGILHSRRHLAISFKGLDHFRPLRIRMLRTESITELDEILNEIKLKWANHSSPFPE